MTKGEDSLAPHWTGSFAPEPGLTKREYFAARAMQAYISTGHRLPEHNAIAQLSVKAADALINALNPTT